ncbi:MAG TPA: nucleotidyltransferase [Anaerolineae bacterium]|nr:nucleotidyltransferase [Anaerolineae bacterium]
MLNQLRGVYSSLRKHKVKYVTIGGIAAILHGVPRATFDLDILIEATPKNAQRLLDALLDAGLGTASLTTAEEVLAHEITIFRDRVSVDVQTKTPGISFSEVWERRQVMKYGRTSFDVLSKEDLIASKLAAGRAKDLEDIRLLVIE